MEEARLLHAKANVAHAEAKLHVAKAALEQVKILIDYAQIRAPYSGLVTKRWADKGDFIANVVNSKSEPLFTIERVDRLRIIFDIPEAESAQIQPEQHATLVVDALKGRTFDGQIARSAGVLDPRTRTLRVEAELDAPDAVLRPGMYGMISIKLAERKDAVFVPARSLRY